MTFEEVERKLPNGFHDAKIRKISFDFVEPSILIGMDLLVGLPDISKPEGYRAGTLKMATPYLFFIEPPDPRYPFLLSGSPVNVDGTSVRVGLRPEVDQLLVVLPPDATAYRFFLEEWNSFLYLAGGDVAFSWDDEGSSL
jgi:hypothetical protein